MTIAGQAFSVSGGVNLPVTVAAGGAYSFNVNFSPASPGAATGQLTIISDSAANGTLVVGLSGTGTTTGASDTTALSALNCTSSSMTGAGTDSCTVTLNAAAATGGFTVSLASSDSAVTVPSSVTVGAGASRASFTATVAAVSTAQTATLTASACSSSVRFALQLSAAAPELNVGTSSIAFGDVPLNTVVTQGIQLTVSGTSAITLSGATVSGAGFSISGLSFPLTITDGQAVTLEVEFDPTTAGAATGQVTITSNSSTGVTVISLSGAGETSSYEVNLGWDAPSSSSDPVAGYNVYRSANGGTSYQQLNASTIGGTTYVDTTVQADATYDYMVESVDASGVTSAPSNIASVTIP